MGRVKAFDESAALEQAMHLFWRQGYSNTTLKQLLTEMDMLNGSFYHCFKDKKTIFQKSLVHYNQKVISKRLEALTRHDDFSTGIRAFFSEVYKTLESKEQPNGCLIANSMVDEVLSDKELKLFLHQGFEQFVKFITDRIQISIDLNHTPNDLPAKQLAYILVTYIQGLFCISNSSVNIKQLKTQTSDFLIALNL